MPSPLTRDRLSLQADADDWIEAIRTSADLLYASGCVTSDYVEAIFKSFEVNGDYMIVVPEVVLAHARPECGALETGLSLLTLRKSVPFTPSPGKGITAVFTLAARDNDEHLDLMRSLAEVLVNDDALEELLTSGDIDTVMDILTLGSP